LTLLKTIISFGLHHDQQLL